MERETRTFKTPGGHEIEIKTYLTARERSQLRSILAEGKEIELNIEEKSPVEAVTTPKTEKIPMSTMMKYQDELVRIAVVRYDGSMEGAFDMVQDGKAEDYDAILEEVSEIQQGNLAVAK